jgi:hypothetical protein
MTDTERSKAPTDVAQTDGSTDTDETTQQNDSGQTFQEVTDATGEERRNPRSTVIGWPISSRTPMGSFGSGSPRRMAASRA